MKYSLAGVCTVMLITSSCCEQGNKGSTLPLSAFSLECPSGASPHRHESGSKSVLYCENREGKISGPYVEYEQDGSVRIGNDAQEVLIHRDGRSRITNR